MDHLDQKVTKEMMADLELDLQDCQDNQESKVRRVYLDFQERMVCKDLLVRLVYLEKGDRKVTEDFLVSMD